MSTLASSHTHNITYVVEGLKSSLLQIVNLFGLSRDNLINNWESTERAIKTWINSGHLYKVSLEIFDSNDAGFLVGKVDMEIDLNSDDDLGDLGRWKNKEAVAAAMAKYIFKGSTLKYRVILSTKQGEPAVDGWGTAESKSSARLTQNHYGTTIGTSTLKVTTSVWN